MLCHSYTPLFSNRPTRHRIERLTPLALLVAATASAQSSHPHRGNAVSSASGPEHCAVFCAPTITLMPGVLRSHLARRPLVRSTATGVEQRLPETSSFQIVATVASRTAVPRVSLYGSV